MDQEPRTAGAPIGPSSETAPARAPEEIRADIERTREQVGETVAALAEKTDVKSRAQQRVTELRATVDRRRHEITARARDTTPETAQRGGRQLAQKLRENPQTAAIGGAILAAFLLGRTTSRRT